MQIKRLVTRNTLLLGRMYRICVDGGTMDVVIRDFMDLDILRCSKYVFAKSSDGVMRLKKEADILVDTNHISWVSLYDMEQFPRIE